LNQRRIRTIHSRQIQSRRLGELSRERPGLRQESVTPSSEIAAANPRATILSLILIILWIGARRPDHLALEPSPALKQVNDQDDDSDYEQQMDQTPANVADEAKKPEHDQNNNYSPKHGYSFRFSETLSIYLSGDLSTRQAFSEDRIEIEP
jgi:hypothetical protein